MDLNETRFQYDTTEVLLGLSAAISLLKNIGYCESRVGERLGLADLSDIRWRALPIYRAERLTPPDALACAIDLFLLQGSVATAELGQLFDDAAMGALVRAGVLAIDERGYVRANISLFPVGEQLIVSDHAWPKLPHPGCQEIPFDQVMFIGADSRWLARATVRRPVEKALDLCTGSGVHALLAASHAQLVTAVDLNARAVHCTRCNAQASGMANIKAIVGDLYEPVANERFDLITANPPFVPSPVHTLGFRDGGRSGEDVQRRIVEGLPAHLAPGGIAQIVTELGERDDEELADRVRGWLGAAPMDIVILRLREYSAADYAMGHAQGDYDFGEFLESVRDWAENLKQQRYERVVSVLLAFQWSEPERPSWTRVEEVAPPSKNAGFEIESMFMVERLVREPDFREILVRSRVRLAGPIGLMESRMLGGNLHAKSQARLLGQALGAVQWLDPMESEVLSAIEEETVDAARLVSSLVCDKGLDREEVFAALTSLIRRRLVLLMNG
jgi:hypothetical protein